MITEKDIKHLVVIVFEHPNGTLHGKIHIIQSGKTTGYVYCNGGGLNNRKPFELIGLQASEFTKKVVGYQCDGGWPEQKNESDFAKVLNAMLKHDHRLKIKIGEKEFGYEGRLSISLDDFFKVK